MYWVWLIVFKIGSLMIVLISPKVSNIVICKIVFEHGTLSVVNESFKASQMSIAWTLVGLKYLFESFVDAWKEAI